MKWFKKDPEKEARYTHSRIYRIVPLGKYSYKVEKKYQWGRNWEDLNYNWRENYFLSEAEALKAIEKDKKYMEQTIQSVIEEEKFRRDNPPRIIE